MYLLLGWKGIVSMKISRNKIKTILIVLAVILIIVIPVGINILFPKYYKLKIDYSEIKCIEVESCNKRQYFVFDKSEDIKIIMDYICSQKYRKENIYEVIASQYHTVIKSKIGYVIKLYSSTECEESDLIKTIKLPQIGGITIDEVKYRLPEEEYPIYGNLYRIIHNEILKDNN